MNNNLSQYKEKLFNKIARTSLGKEVFGRIGQSLDDKRWVFILGCYNSGTTLLQRLMLSHPDIAGMPAEGVAYTDVIVRPEEYGWTRMWWKCRDRIQSDSDYTLSGATKLKSQWSWMMNKRNAPVLLEKSIVNVLHADFFNKYFGRPKFIHLVRNGYAVSEGIRRKAIPSRWGNPQYGDKYPIELCAQQWVETLQEIDRLRKSDFDILEITYEELTSSPDTVLKKIYEFIDVSRIEDNVNDKEWLVHGKAEKIKNMNPKSIKSLTENERYTINSYSRKWLKYYYYD